MLTRDEMPITTVDGTAYDDGGGDETYVDDDDCEDNDNDVDIDGSDTDVDTDGADDSEDDENNYENDITRYRIQRRRQHEDGDD